MATGTKANFKVYNEFIHSGLVETLTQNSDAFNAASRGAIRLASVNRRGDYVYESFFKNTADLVSRRITSGTGSTSTVDDLALQQDEHISVKVNRKIGPVANTLDSFKKIQAGPFNENALNFAIGQQAAKAMQVDQINTVIRAGRAALSNQSDALFTVPSSGTLKTSSLVSGLSKRGDASDSVILWVMHSKAYFDLVQYQITPTNNGDLIANAAVVDGSPTTLGRPVLIIDSPALAISSGSPQVTDYYTLGLTANAFTVEDSEETTIVSEFVTGSENLLVRYQGEFAYNVSLRGFKWDVQNGGGDNPTDTNIGTGSNWDPAMASVKDWGGVVIKSR